MTEYPYFPLFVNLFGKKILIVGAGSMDLSVTLCREIFPEQVWRRSGSLS